MFEDLHFPLVEDQYGYVWIDDDGHCLQDSETFPVRLSDGMAGYVDEVPTSGNSQRNELSDDVVSPRISTPPAIKSASFRSDLSLTYNNALSSVQQQSRGDMPYEINDGHHTGTNDQSPTPIADGHVKEAPPHARYTYTLDNRYKCKICGTVIKLKHDMSRHLRHKHDNARTACCPHCGKVFARRDNISRHTEIYHSGKTTNKGA